MKSMMNQLIKACHDIPIIKDHGVYTPHARTGDWHHVSFSMENGNILNVTWNPMERQFNMNRIRPRPDGSAVIIFLKAKYYDGKWCQKPIKTVEEAEECIRDHYNMTYPDDCTTNDVK